MEINDTKDVLGVRNADLSGSTFRDVNLGEARFEDINFKGARFTNVNLTDVEIDDCDVKGMKIQGLLVSELLKAARRVKSVNWMDMIVSDTDGVSRFYEEVAGLEREAVDEGGGHVSYSLKDDAGNEVLGICDAAVFPDWVEGWLPYIDVEDFDGKVAKVEAAGGVILKRMTMDYRRPGQRFCLVKDPLGAPMMLCEA